MTETLRADARPARIAVNLLFLTNGALFANLVPRYPGIKAELGISNAVFGLSVAAFAAGALVAGLAAGVLIRRWRSSRVAVFGTILIALGVIAAGLSGSVLVFTVSLFFIGAMDAIIDVAQNAHGLRVQRHYGRSIINSFHAVWSIGAVLGGLMAALAISLNVPIAVHLSISAMIFVSVALLAYRFLLKGPDEDGSVADEKALQNPSDSPLGTTTVAVKGSRTPSRIAVFAVLLALVLIATAGTIVEDAGSSWASLYLFGSLGASESVAAFGFIALVGAQFFGRLIGDRLVDRFGQRAVVAAGGLIAAFGMGLALAFPSIPGTIVGFGAAGFGVATFVPAAMQAANELPGLRPGTGLTIVSWLMRLGYLLSPPIVGLIADSTSLRVGLLIVPAVTLAVVALSLVLGKRRSS
ncbi:MAG: MFS transporter [Microbacteriaceae bacterium]